MDSRKVALFLHLASTMRVSTNVIWSGYYLVLRSTDYMDVKNDYHWLCLIMPYFVSFYLLHFFSCFPFPFRFLFSFQLSFSYSKLIRGCITYRCGAIWHLAVGCGQSNPRRRKMAPSSGHVFYSKSTFNPSPPHTAYNDSGFFPSKFKVVWGWTWIKSGLWIKHMPGSYVWGAVSVPSIHPVCISRRTRLPRAWRNVLRLR